MSNHKNAAEENNPLAGLGAMQTNIFTDENESSQRLRQLRQRRRASANPEEIEALNAEIVGLTEQLNQALIKDGNTYRFRRFEMSLTEVKFPAELTRDEADEFGAMLSGMEDALNWWRGAWANLYVADAKDDNERGKIYDELADLFNMDSRTLRNCASIDRNVEVSRRRDTLTFSHHVEVASFVGEDQDYWLDRAEQGDDGKRWSVRRLRQEIAVSKKTALPVPDPVKHFESTTVQSIRKSLMTAIDNKVPKTVVIRQLKAILKDLSDET